MNLLFLIGDCADGKKTVGQALAKISGFRLLYHHLIADPMLEIFGSANPEIILHLRDLILAEFAASDQYGLIFTGAEGCDIQMQWDDLAHIRKIFEPYHTQFYYVELPKSRQRQFVHDTANHFHLPKTFQLNSRHRKQKRLQCNQTHHPACCIEPSAEPNYLRIDSTGMDPKAVAERIKTYFSF